MQEILRMDESKGLLRTGVSNSALRSRSLLSETRVVLATVGKSVLLRVYTLQYPFVYTLWIHAFKFIFYNGRS